ncbi:MAG: thioredoxin family protein [Candidatus Taylorbacteria bacterium]|nr:thioredoxin family protein [Candidatus Taylorbacteria bacterium]
MITVTEIVSPGCEHCARAKKFFEEKFKPANPDVKVEYVDVAEERGQELVQKHMIFASPGILIDGELFSTGGLDEKKFLQKIAELKGEK